METTTTISEVGIDHADAVKLRAAQRAEIAARYGDAAREPGRVPSADDMSAFFLAYVEDIPAGCGGVLDLGDGSGEVQRMYVTPAHRGTGIAPQILAAIEDYARAHGITRLMLETGVLQPDAMRFYEREGYTRIENYGPYTGDELSVCYAKPL